VQELIAESMLESDAAMIAAITRPTAPAGNASDMKYGRSLSVWNSGGSRRATWKVREQREADERQARSSTAHRRRVDDEGLPALP
jgi:hypothetical protein